MKSPLPRMIRAALLAFVVLLCIILPASAEGVGVIDRIDAVHLVDGRAVYGTVLLKTPKSLLVAARIFDEEQRPAGVTEVTIPREYIRFIEEDVDLDADGEDDIVIEEETPEEAAAGAEVAWFSAKPVDGQLTIVGEGSPLPRRAGKGAGKNEGFSLAAAAGGGLERILSSPTGNLDLLGGRTFGDIRDGSLTTTSGGSLGGGTTGGGGGGGLIGLPDIDDVQTIDDLNDLPLPAGGDVGDGVSDVIDNIDYTGDGTGGGDSDDGDDDGDDSTDIGGGNDAATPDAADGGRVSIESPPYVGDKTGIPAGAATAFSDILKGNADITTLARVVAIPEDQMRVILQQAVAADPQVAEIVEEMGGMDAAIEQITEMQDQAAELLEDPEAMADLFDFLENNGDAIDDFLGGGGLDGALGDLDLDGLLGD